MRRGRFLAKQDVLLAPYDLQLTIKYSKMDQLGKGSIITMGLTRSSLLSSPTESEYNSYPRLTWYPNQTWEKSTMPLSAIHQGSGDINNHIISLFKDPLDTKHETYKDDTLTEGAHGFHGILNWFPPPLP